MDLLCILIFSFKFFYLSKRKNVRVDIKVNEMKYGSYSFDIHTHLWRYIHSNS